MAKKNQKNDKIIVSTAPDNGAELDMQTKKEIKKAVEKVVKEYGEALRLLGQE